MPADDVAQWLAAACRGACKPPHEDRSCGCKKRQYFGPLPAAITGTLIDPGCAGWSTFRVKRYAISPYYVMVDRQKDLSMQFLHKIFRGN